jgi:predicted RNA binding protein YcfA (HicA-like mRNA interferase family)
MKIRDVIKLVESDGWRVVQQRGSHRQFRHSSKPGKVTVAGHPAADMAPKTLRSILKQAGLKT